jgi:hypothetical protein
MTRAFILSALTLAVAALWAVPARAVKPFKDQFEAKYVKADSTAAADVALAEAVKKARCNVCHEGKSKKQRNAYGAALNKLITMADKDDKAKIVQALDQVAGMKCNPKDDKSATFGDRIRQGKLPCEPK